MKRPQLKPYLLNWLNTNQGWHRKVDLYIVGDQIEHSAESTGRALRDLAEEGKIDVDYYNGRWAKGLAKYSSKGTPVQKTHYKVIDGVAVLING